MVWVSGRASRRRGTCRAASLVGPLRAKKFVLQKRTQTETCLSIVCRCLWNAFLRELCDGRDGARRLPGEATLEQGSIER